MLLDKNGKIKGKFSIVDAAVIVLVLVVIAGICVRYSSVVTGAVKSSESFRYVVKVPSVRVYTLNALVVGDNVTDKQSSKVLGKIVDVKSETATHTATTADGRIIQAQIADRLDCYVTIEAEGKESNESYLLHDSTELSVGREVELYTERCKTTGEITFVEVIE